MRRSCSSVPRSGNARSDTSHRSHRGRRMSHTVGCTHRRLRCTLPVRSDRAASIRRTSRLRRSRRSHHTFDTGGRTRTSLRCIARFLLGKRLLDKCRRSHRSHHSSHTVVRRRRPPDCRPALDSHRHPRGTHHRSRRWRRRLHSMGCRPRVRSLPGARRSPEKSTRPNALRGWCTSRRRRCSEWHDKQRDPLRKQSTRLRTPDRGSRERTPGTGCHPGYTPKGPSKDGCTSLDRQPRV